MAKSHSAGMRICYAIFAGISLRLCSISLRSFRITFAAYLPTHFKSLRDFFQSLLNYHRDNLYIISPNTHPHTIREIYHPQKKSVRSVRSVWAQENTKPHTIREISHPQKNQWDPWDLCEPKKRSIIFPPGVPQRRQIYLLHDRWSRGVRWWWL